MLLSIPEVQRGTVWFNVVDFNNEMDTLTYVIQSMNNLEVKTKGGLQ